jgi:hypothetical protein
MAYAQDFFEWRRKRPSPLMKDDLIWRPAIFHRKAWQWAFSFFLKKYVHKPGQYGRSVAHFRKCER